MHPAIQSNSNVAPTMRRDFAVEPPRPTPFTLSSGNKSYTYTESQRREFGQGSSGRKFGIGSSGRNFSQA